ncbi:MAG: plasmid mobilization protein [Janthinobacterium lividum]
MNEPEVQPEEAKPHKGLVKRFRASPGEVKKMQDKAALAGLTFSEYCRRAALDKPVTERLPGSLRQALAASSSNLNQLTRLANAGKLPGVGIEELNQLLGSFLQALR